MDELRTFVIAMAGKGGTGKTTISALLIRYLLNKNLLPVLVVDADANANLNELLGLKVERTLGQVRDEMKTAVPTGMTKETYIEYKMQEALIESKGFDLLIMGQPEGPGCYCAANNLLAKYLEILTRNYRIVIVDNEAGMEHLSRLNLREIDILISVSDPGPRGIMTAKRIADLTTHLDVQVGKKVLIVNRTPDGLDPMLQEEISKSGLVLGGTIRQDTLLAAYELKKLSFLDLPSESAAVQDAETIFDALIRGKLKAQS
ncbi:MAG: AAA family ATPase [Deltaproteobacteria bacterium]|nr:AAA family ATPase [Deltaproteobacteria bacterium]MDP3028188.1 AAA family ATPase [Deltaproteobacteria bacterium]